ncbi:alpha/beta fold hydrolase [Qipengyuania sp. 6B39]|uniref:alpha/beta fold hydrolase BchO n=1 Tax=Qipengyuania proteolytica TaxID=2867239 RepID=UPI001C8999E3|nr:alpha/beta fold hydrolase BchO [Qipengyuania proteolytica]MBX7497074.1 alpha/beta fold hydrolase [Qipengyuania proteolytica]
MSALRWDREGRDWPHREASRFVEAAGLRWHVQVEGTGPVLLLLHGTGASAHSWRGMLGSLAEHFTVVAPDLPGHGFTKGRVRSGPTLPRIAAAVEALLEQLALSPAIIVGHSAGAAVALELARTSGTPVVGLSAALMPFPGLAARLFPALAKVLFVNPFVPSIFARIARSSGEVARFIPRATNSQIDAEGLRCYATLLGNSEHCAGALAMMASWDLETLKERLPSIAAPVLLAHGTRDNAVPIDSAEEACTLLPACRFERFEGLGHLAHEERPDLATALILRVAEEHAILHAEGA